MFIDLLRTRRSIRQFQDTPVEKEKVELLVEAMLRSPSGKSLRPWEFVVVSDPATLNGLAMAKPHGATLIKNAPLAIVVCADTEKSDIWVEDCSIAALIVHLAATDMGLGSCWVQLRARDHDSGISAGDYVKKLLGLGVNMDVEAVIAIGYGKEEKIGHDKASLPYDKVSYEKYGQKN